MKAIQFPEQRDLKRSSESTAKDLKKLSGKEFDRRCVALQVTRHQELLGSIDKSFLPSVQNAELKTSLTQVRESVSMHLEEAKSLQTTLGTAGWRNASNVSSRGVTLGLDLDLKASTI